MGSFNSYFTRAAVLGFLLTLLAYPAQSSAKCPGVHYGSRYLGWSKIFRSDAWPYYEKNRQLVRLENLQDTDQIFINGCNAGEARDISRVYLDPGTYNLTIKRNGRDVLSRSFSAENGKTMNLSVGAANK